MPHLVVLYTPNIEALLPESKVACGMGDFCRQLADAMLQVKDENEKAVFPTGGTRVLAFAAQHWAIADGGAASLATGGSGDYGFMYLNLRMGAGRSAATQQRAGESVLNVAKKVLAPLLTKHPIGLTVQVDESPGQVFDAKFSSIHPLFAAA